MFKHLEKVASHRRLLMENSPSRARLDPLVLKSLKKITPTRKSSILLRGFSTSKNNNHLQLYQSLETPSNILEKKESVLAFKDRNESKYLLGLMEPQKLSHRRGNSSLIERNQFRLEPITTTNQDSNYAQQNEFDDTNNIGEADLSRNLMPSLSR